MAENFSRTAALAAPAALAAHADAGPGSRTLLWCWRHPRAIGASGRCIGRSDLPVDPRKAKRLAHRLRGQARRHGLPHEVWVSTLQRSLAVGQWLARWGWRLHVDARLCELDFGAWDGLPWADIARAEVAAWEADLLHHAPGGGESLAQLAQRVQAFVEASQPAAAGPRLLVTHGGWINALLHLRLHSPLHHPLGAPLSPASIDAAHWPPPPPHGALRRWPSTAR